MAIRYTFKDGLYIDGVWYKAPLVTCVISPKFLWKYAERTEDGVHNGEILGSFFNYSITCGSINSQEDLKALLGKLTEPVEYHTVKLPDWTGEFVDMSMYFEVDSIEVKKSKIDTSFKDLKFKAVPRNPTRS